MGEGAGIDRWEEAFDSWTPRRSAAPSDDTGVDLDRAALLRLARELAEKRRGLDRQADTELEQLKQSLRERAEAIAARERELADLQKRLAGGKPRKQAQPEPADTQGLAGRGRGRRRAGRRGGGRRGGGGGRGGRGGGSCWSVRPSSKRRLTASRSASA